MVNVCEKFESDWTKTVPCTVSTSYKSNYLPVTLTFDLLTPNSIGFFLSSRSMFVRSLKVIGLKLWPVECPQGINHPHTHTHTHPLTHTLIHAHTHERRRYYIPRATLLRGDNKHLQTKVYKGPASLGNTFRAKLLTVPI